MVFLHIQKHFGARLSEWMLAAVLFSWGLILLRAEDTFAASPAYLGLARIADEQTWAIFCTGAGALRLLALTINGLWVPTTYHLRAITSFISCFFWFQISLGFATSGLGSTGLAVYPWLLVWDIISCHRTAVDYRMDRASKMSLAT